MFESGAILLYLADKTGQFGPKDTRRSGRRLNEWLFWQAANQGPMAGQLSHFVNYAPGRVRIIPYETLSAASIERTLAVLDQSAGGIATTSLPTYSIVDMMAFPWAFIAKPLGVIAGPRFPNVTAWRQRT